MTAQAAEPPGSLPWESVGISSEGRAAGLSQPQHQLPLQRREQQKQARGSVEKMLSFLQVTGF